ncbi:hypothetical protein [Novosphingobium aquimarinum]|uniref:hypothetical protein n=1 Tax=Novosphingobium aquimarinum TaxID=2682494 RepID=UPI0012EC5D8C|nr:hypothetical protein [Novosphingobium aquimarinum]
MASRLLLTLLALLTGLAAQVSPARAAECARAAQVVAATANPVAPRPSSVPIELRNPPRLHSRAFRGERAPLHEAGQIVVPAPVLPGIDRAHE